MQLQSCARIPFGEIGAWHCCANKCEFIDVIINKVQEVNIVVLYFEILYINKKQQ